MKNITFISMLILVVGCSTKSRFSGKYSSKNNPNSFQFNIDSSFLNEYREGHRVKYSIGVWKMLTKNSVVLNTKIKSIDIPLIINQLDTSKAREVNLSIELKINGGLELSNYYCSIYINDKVFKVKRADSISSIRLEPSVQSIYFAFLKAPKTSYQYIFPVTTRKVKFDKPLTQNLKIEISFDDLFFTYHPFNNDTIRITKKHIEIFNQYLNKWQRIPKIPNSKNIFVHFKE